MMHKRKNLPHMPQSKNARRPCGTDSRMTHSANSQQGTRGHVFVVDQLGGSMNECKSRLEKTMRRDSHMGGKRATVVAPLCATSPISIWTISVCHPKMAPRFFATAPYALFRLMAGNLKAFLFLNTILFKVKQKYESLHVRCSAVQICAGIRWTWMRYVWSNAKYLTDASSRSA